jgi:hypothetical protein
MLLLLYYYYYYYYYYRGVPFKYKPVRAAAGADYSTPMPLYKSSSQIGIHRKPVPAVSKASFLIIVLLMSPDLQPEGVRASLTLFHIQHLFERQPDGRR